jgi:hypothetical protein
MADNMTKQKNKNALEVDDGVPSVAIEWIVRNNTASNVELAILSNVCRQWREVVTNCILIENPKQKQEEESSTPNQSSCRHHPFQSLLLPSMVRHLYLLQSASQNSRDTISNNPEFEDINETDTIYDGNDQQRQQPIEDTYCVAWFHPDGIEFIKLDRDGGDDKDDGDDDNGSAIGYPTSTAMYVGDHRTPSGDDDDDCNENGFALAGGVGSEDGTRPGHSRRNRSKSPAPLLAMGLGGASANNRLSQGEKPSGISRGQQEHQKDLVTCLYQWNGYSEAMDILRHFGYAPAFVRRILDHALDRQPQADAIQPKPSSSTYSSASSLSGRDRMVGPPIPPFSSFAVRGATYARPGKFQRV